MTAATLERTWGAQADAQPVTERPPTLFGQTSPWPLVQAGHTLARQAIGCALEALPRDVAVKTLIDQLPDRDVARMADHYLAFTSFDVPSTVQTQALFLVEDVQHELEQRQRRTNGPVSRLARWLGARLTGRAVDRSDSRTTGGRLRPA